MWLDPWIRKIPWRREGQSTPVFLPGDSYGQRSLVGYSPWGCKESNMPEVTACTQHIWKLTGPYPGASLAFCDGPRSVYGVRISLNKCSFTSLWLALEFFSIWSQEPTLDSHPRNSPETWDMTIFSHPNLFPATEPDTYPTWGLKISERIHEKEAWRGQG